ncbi:MAG: peptidase M3 [Planctomycetes bacterium]|nr:peptidase M3 [Planctomycetota bacterium]
MDTTTIRALARTAIDASASAVDDFHEILDGADYERVVQGLDDILLPLNGIEGRAQVFSKVHPEADMRDAAREIEQEIAGWMTELSQNRGIYDRLALYEHVTPPSSEQGRVVELALETLRRDGVDRDEATRDRIKQLKSDIVRIGQDFDHNIIKGGIEVRVAEGHAGLAGLPQDFLDSHPETDDGSVVLTTDPQDRLAIMTYADDDDLRRRYYHACMNRAAPHNIAVLQQLMQKRHELSQLLGHAHWADYVTEDKMAKSGKRARTFIDGVIEAARERAGHEYEELLAEKRSVHPESTVVFEWERSYLTEKIKRRRLDFDSQEARPYFAYDRIKAGVIATSAALYGIEFRPQDDEVWHPSVESWEILDDGEVIARFKLDMHPRDNKFKHAAMFSLTAGIDGHTVPEACLVCNFPEPKDDDPALMQAAQVRTFFHEFGHLLHHLFSRQPHARIAGLQCEWDFVEVPSQLYEEWAWDYDVLTICARHWDTDESIPKELVERMRSAEEYGKGLQTLTQMFFARVSLGLYESDPANIDPMARMIELKQELLPFPHEDDTCFLASFGHLNGYSAMYYTYMWSLVISKDLFSRFRGNLMEPETAASYRREVLSRGGSKEAAAMVHSFLGRDYGFDAFADWLNS